MQSDDTSSVYTPLGVLPAGKQCFLDSETRSLFLLEQGRPLRSVALHPLQAIIIQTLLASYPEPCDCDDLYAALEQRTGCPQDQLLPTLLKECRTLLHPFYLGMSSWSAWVWICKLEEEEVDP